MYTYANICTYTYMYIYMHMHTYIYISPQLVHARLCNGAAASFPWKLLRNYFESFANIVQAVVLNSKTDWTLQILPKEKTY